VLNGTSRDLPGIVVVVFVLGRSLDGFGGGRSVALFDDLLLFLALFAFPQFRDAGPQPPSDSLDLRLHVGQHVQLAAGGFRRTETQIQDPDQIPLDTLRGKNVRANQLSDHLHNMYNLDDR
jgi:hypothetical protein